MIKLLHCILFPLMLLGCAHHISSNISETSIAKDLDFRTTLYVQDGKVLPSEPFTYLNTGRYKVWVLMLVGPDENGDFQNIGLRPEFHGTLSLKTIGGAEVEHITVNRDQRRYPVGTFMTGVIPLRNKHRRQEIQITGENLNLPDQCKVGSCKVMLQIRKFNFSDYGRPW